MVVTDTRPGSADDLWLCSWAIALAAAAPSGGYLLLSGFGSLSPTFSAVGRDDIDPNTVRTTQSVPLTR